MIPDPLACPCCNSRDHLALHDHIVDVWFESGVSHSAVLGRQDGLPWPSDVYLEGHDQYRGWFQSSLLVAVNDRGLAPFRQVVTHGFTLDGKGRKMSKSLGNVIPPSDVINQRGGDILRLWVSMIDFLEDMRLSDEILQRNAEAYRKIRNTIRYLLGNLNDFDPRTDSVPYDAMEEIDRWALQQLELAREAWVKAYENHQYHAVYHGVHGFCNVTLSSFYLDILKDRLYTYPPNDPARRSAQTVLYKLARDISRLIAPVLCFTAEEMWQELQKIDGAEGWTTDSVHAELFPPPLAVPRDAELIQRWDRLMAIREEVNKALEAARNAKRINGSLEARVVVHSPDADTVEFLESFGDDLRFLFITSGFELGTTGNDAFRSEEIAGLAIEIHPAEGKKCERCWNFTTDVGTDDEWPEICRRCSGSVRQILSETGPA